METMTNSCLRMVKAAGVCFGGKHYWHPLLAEMIGEAATVHPCDGGGILVTPKYGQPICIGTETDTTLIRDRERSHTSRQAPS